MNLKPMPISNSWPRLFIVAYLSCLLGACGSPGGAPVVSRDNPSLTIPVYANHYKVKPGDTLYAIAWNVGVDYKELAEWNQIRYPYTIYAGQQLRLKPVKVTKQKTASTKSTIGKLPKRKKTSTASQKTKKIASKPSITKNNAVKDIKPPVSLGLTRKLKWQWPTSGTVIQRFSKRSQSNKGMKIRGRLGQSVRAAESGRVVYSGSGLIGYGPLIIIKHDKNYLSAYGYNRKLLVSEGDEVLKGERIAEMGLASDGRALLHFEIRRGGKPVDPAALLPKQ